MEVKPSPTTEEIKRLAAQIAVDAIQDLEDADESISRLVLLVACLAGDIDSHHQEINRLKRRVLVLEGRGDIIPEALRP
jgi:hypothetical protein